MEMSQADDNLIYIIIYINKSYSLAVHTANSICMESKKKNMTNNEMDAPKGRHSACIVSNVANLSVLNMREKIKYYYVHARILHIIIIMEEWKQARKK